MSGDVLAPAAKAVDSPVRTLSPSFTNHFTIVPQGIRFELSPLCNKSARAEAAFEVVRLDELKLYLKSDLPLK